MKRLFYVRHGESELNVADLWAGISETPLTAKGIAQAKEAGKLLKAKAPKIDLMISSPLSRAYDTATNIAKEIGYPEDNILIVSHGSFGRALRRVVADIPYHHEYLDSHRDKYRIGNAEIVEVI